MRCGPVITISFLYVLQSKRSTGFTLHALATCYAVRSIFHVTKIAAVTSAYFTCSLLKYSSVETFSGVIRPTVGRYLKKKNVTSMVGAKLRTSCKNLFSK